MGIRLQRQKKRNWLLSSFYLLNRIAPFSNKFKLRLFLNLEWIFDRFVTEMSFKIYSSEEHPFRQHALAFILKNIQSTDTVLDLGCKHGEIANAVAEKVKTVIGIDMDSESVQLAKLTFHRANLSFINADAVSYLNESNQEFDTLIMSHILEHLDKPEEILMFCREHFKNIYIEVPDFDKSYLNHYRLKEGVKLIYSDNDHVNEFDRFEIKKLIMDCGLNIIEEEFRFGVQRFWCSTL